MFLLFLLLLLFVVVVVVVGGGGGGGRGGCLTPEQHDSLSQGHPSNMAAYLRAS